MISRRTIRVMDILYKYVRADRVMNCLPEMGDGTLRATQPSALNDPFECAARFFVRESDQKDEGPMTYCAYARGLTSINEASPVTSCMVRRAYEEYRSLFARELLATQLSTRFGIVSFSEDHLNILMWSHYTTDGSGFVIGYDMQELQNLGGTGGCLRPVEYDTDLFTVSVTLDDGEHARLVSSRLDWRVPLSRKSKDWEYEKEWRLIIELNQTIGTGQTDPHGQPINLVRIPNQAVVSVFHTERTPRQAVDEVGKRLADPNNRYTAEGPRRLIPASNAYAYVEESQS